MDALKEFPSMETKIFTDKGDAICHKIDIFKGLMWFAYTNNFGAWHTLSVKNVQEIIRLNKQKLPVISLEAFAVEVVVDPKKEFKSVVIEESLTRFDAPKKSKNNRNKSRNKKNGTKPQ